MNLSNKNIVLTGSNRGIGLSTLEALHKQGANIIACSKKKDEELISKSKKLNKINKNQIYNYFFDLSDEDQVITQANKIINDFETIDCLINNAGINHVSLFLMEKSEDLKKVFQINYFSQLVLTKIIVKKMITKKNGKIIFLSSKAAVDSIPGRLAYASSKSLLINATKILSKEFGRLNIKVNAIAPGMIDTDMLSKQLNSDEIEELKKRIPLNKIGKTEDVANLICFLCSDSANYINGQIINLDGGQY